MLIKLKSKVKSIFRVKRNVYILIVLILTILILSTFLLLKHINSLLPEIPKDITVTSMLWVDETSVYRREILSSNNEVYFKINHAELVIDKKSLSNGFDINVIGFSLSNNEYKYLNYEIFNIDTIDTVIKFNKDNSYTNYYIYYGDRTKLSNEFQINTNNSSSSQTIEIDLTKLSNLSFEEKPLISIYSEKLWNLNEEVLNDVTIDIESSNNIDLNKSDIWVIYNNDVNNYSKTVIKNSKIVLDNLKLNTGVNEVYIILRIDNIVYRSNTSTFIYTHPLYISWSIDYEGIVPSENQFQILNNALEEFNINVTHFFNPRTYIYIKTNEVKREEITDWVSDRLTKGDDLALHLHMQHDLVEEVGIDAKYTGETWDNGENGYDTLITNYSKDEIKLLLNWSIDKIKTQFKKFSDYDIKDIKGFRSGGWFMNNEILQALVETGFVYDSSGRESVKLGKNDVLQSWELDTLVQSYIPLKKNISNGIFIDNYNEFKNISEEEFNNTYLNIIEIPNNGLDGYTQEASQLIEIFEQQYPSNTILGIDRLISYSSHIDWLDLEINSIKQLFNILNNYRADRDLGAVKFVTYEQYIKSSKGLNSLLNFKIK